MIIDNKVYLTASATMSCAGNNNQELFENICKGNTGIKQVTDYFYNATPAIGKIDSKENFYDNLYSQCNEVLQNSSLENFENTLLIIGSSVGGMALTEEIYFSTNNYKNIDPKLHNINTISHLLNQKYKFKDHISFSTACTSSANGLGYAYEVLKKGIYKNALVVGIDQLSQTTVGGFLSLGVLSSNPCKPFCENRKGMNVAEAIAVALVETKPSENSIEVCGVGYSSDAHHMTQPSPDGAGAKKAMENALKCAELLPEDIVYINAHGTGTSANDAAEANAIETLFMNKPYVGSTKAITGHTLGAAGLLEAVISSLVLEEQIIPKSTGIDNPENKNIRFSFENKDENIKYVMSNSFAFGGNNCSLVFGKVM